MPIKIAIVGCGQIGSRHLQGLSKLDQLTTIYLVDESSKAIEVAQERFEEVVNKEKKGWFDLKVRSINKIEDDIDVAIIATNSLNRAKLTKELISLNKVKYIVFEKFLFQKKSDYDEVRSLLSENNIKSWVNQWMSSSTAFREMLLWFDGKLEKVAISGNNWGMACNSVHFIDFFDYASNREGVHVMDCSLDKEILKSKRKGYFELTGRMSFVSNNMEFSISSESVDGEVAIDILMQGDSRKLEAELSLGLLKVVYYYENGEISRKEYSLPMQSESTGNLVGHIIAKSECNLPTYQQSMGHHLLLFKCFEKVFKAASQDIVGCPIT